MSSFRSPPNSKLYEKCGSVPHSWAIKRGRLRWLGHVLQMKNDGLPNVVLVHESSRAKRKAGRSRMQWENTVRK